MSTAGLVRVGLPRAFAAIVLSCTVALLVPAPARTQDVPEDQEPSGRWDTMSPRGQTRTLAFTTTEGTDMSVSVGAHTIYFDLLGQIYRVPVEGGAAQSLTQDSGVALNFHPAISPDERTLAFISDRGGQDGLWLLEPESGKARLLFMDKQSRLSEPAWFPDGQSILAIRSFPTPGRGWHRATVRLWRFPLDGSAPIEVFGSPAAQVGSAQAAPDGTSIYFHISYPTANRYGSQAGHEIFRLDLASRALQKITRPREPAPDPARFQLADPSLFPRTGDAELAPVPSPDGAWLAFVREMPTEPFRYRGHSLTPSSAIWVKSLRTGEEFELRASRFKDLARGHAMYSYRLAPAFAWTADSRRLIFSAAGKLWRAEVPANTLAPIAFSAEVRRVLSERTRSHVSIRDDSFVSRFLQWPASSPDGKRLAFVADGRVWWMELPSGSPRRLTAGDDESLELTPSWSSDGRSLIFSTWSAASRGHLWRIDLAGGPATRITKDPGEYAYPCPASDGSVVVSRHTDARRAEEDWNPWVTRTWQIVRLAQDGTATKVAEVPSPRLACANALGRVTYFAQPDASAARGLWQPFPTDQALAQDVVVFETNGKTGAAREVLRLPPEYDEGFRPQLSPDGRWVAYEVDRHVYLNSVKGAKPPRLNVDPNVADANRRLVSPMGGTFARWRNAHVLEFMSGNAYFTYDVRSGARASIPIHLQLPRVSGRGRLALTGARLITLDAPGTLERGTIIVKDARIECVGVCDLKDVDRVIDVGGLTIMPGLVDVHSHHLAEPVDIVPLKRPASALALAYGVTTIVDPSVSSSTAFPLAELTEGGRLIGPRAFTTSEIVVSPGTGFGYRRDIVTLRDALDQVSRRTAWGAVSIKNFRQSRREQTQMLIEAARYLGVTVTGEGGPTSFDLGLVMDGQTGWEHPLMSLPVYSDVTQFLGRAGIVYSPTAIVAGHPKGAAEYFRPREAALASEKYRRFAPASYLKLKLQYAQKTPLEEFSFPFIAEGAADVMHAGSAVAIGEHGEQYGIGSHWEIWAYAFALTNEEALRAATLGGASFIGLENEVGSLRPGKLADLLVLTGNPLKDIHQTASIRSVMKAGVLYDGDTLDQSWPRAVPYGVLPWHELPTAPPSDSLPPRPWELR